MARVLTLDEKNVDGWSTVSIPAAVDPDGAIWAATTRGQNLSSTEDNLVDYMQLDYDP
jgi:hypothetical protein